MRPDPEPQAGFTLFEVLVALAVLAAVMAAVGSLASVGRRANRAEVARVELAQVARRLVNELTDRSFANGASGASDGYAWRIEAEPLPTVPPPANALQTPQAARQSVWIPFRVRLHVTGPTGASADIVTIRLGRVS